MDWSAAMDIYCERTSAAFWAEPLNALSNIAFILAAGVGLVLAVKTNRLNGINALLIGLAALVGIGSFLFHTYANRWSDIADIVPIWTFIFIYILAALNGFFDLAWARVWRIGLIILAVTASIFYLMPANVDSNATMLNGSEQYIPAVIALLVFGYALQRRRHPAAAYIWAGGVTFVLSLGFRTLDNALCTALPAGTHFGWHLCNGLLIGLLLLAIIRHGTPLRPAVSP